MVSKLECVNDSESVSCINIHVEGYGKKKCGICPHAQQEATTTCYCWWLPNDKIYFPFQSGQPCSHEKRTFRLKVQE